MTRAAQRVLVTLSFELDRLEVRAAMGADFSGDHGITVESCAFALIDAHKAESGYVRWSVTDV